MFEFFLRYRNVSVLAGVLLVQFILLGYQVKRQDDVRLLRVWTVGAITPIQKGLNRVASALVETWRDYVWLVGTRRQNEELRGQVSRLKLENQQFRRALARFDREDELAAYQREIKSETVAAQVIGRGSNPNSKEVFLDKGTDDGVQAGMPVITAEGIAGRVRAAYGGASLVRLVHDVEAGVGVLLERSRARGVMKGSGQPSECRIDYIRGEVDVAVGELIYTSGDDRVYPKGLPVGKVTRVEEGSEFQRIHVAPAAALDRLDEVLVVRSGVHEEIPQHPQPQAPQFLMPPPQPEPVASEEVASGGVPKQGLERTPAAPLLTDADRVRERYQAVAAAQGHVFGEGAPGTPVPDFNLDPSVRRPATHAEEPNDTENVIDGDFSQGGETEMPGGSVRSETAERGGETARAPSGSGETSSEQ